MSVPVTLVTGGSRGIGMEVARHFAHLGHTVVACGRSPRADELPAGVGYVPLDVTDERLVCSTVRGIHKEFGRLDNLINCAGVASMNQVVLTPVESFRRIIDVNLVGTFIVSRECAKVMIRHGEGSIINFTTVGVPLRIQGEAAYVASKAGVEAFTRAFAAEVATFGITVNAIGPAPTDTSMLKGVPAEQIESLVARLAVPRLGAVADVVNLIETLIDRRNRSVTGQVIYMGGVS